MAVTPYLYRDLKLRQFNRAGEPVDTITNVLSSSGILHTRNLTLGTVDEYNYDTCRRLDDLLRLLPSDSLYRFQYDAVHLPSCQQLISLWKHQRRLTNLHLDFSFSPHKVSSTALGPFKSDSASNPPTSLEPDYAQYNGCTLQIAVQENSQLLRALTYVRELHIVLGGMVKDSDYQRVLEIVLNDRLERLIYKARKIPANKPILPLSALRHLAFHYTLFPCSPSSGERPLASLTHLELVGCERIDRLVNMLGIPNLASLTYQHICDGSTAERNFGDTLCVLAMIKLFNRLERLVLDCPKCIIGHHCPKLKKSILAHKRSLTSLLISCFYFPRAQMQSVLCAIHKCRKLKQLSVPLDSDPETLFGDYKVG